VAWHCFELSLISTSRSIVARSHRLYDVLEGRRNGTSKRRSPSNPGPRTVRKLECGARARSLGGGGLGDGRYARRRRKRKKERREKKVAAVMTRYCAVW
jgi:hypothetical protein